MAMGPTKWLVGRHVVSISLDDMTYNALQEMATKEDRNLSSMIRQLIVRAVTAKEIAAKIVVAG